MDVFHCQGTVTHIDENGPVADRSFRSYSYVGKNIYSSLHKIPCAQSITNFREQNDIRLVTCQLSIGDQDDNFDLMLDIFKINSGLFDFKLTEKKISIGGDSVTNFQGLCGFADS